MAACLIQSHPPSSTIILRADPSGSRVRSLDGGRTITRNVWRSRNSQIVAADHFFVTFNRSVRPAQVVFYCILVDSRHKTGDARPREVRCRLRKCRTTKLQ